MTIECYESKCPYHSCHYGGEGPFCDEDECQNPDDLLRIPLKGTPAYQKVVDAGCGGKFDYWGEFDCSHSYDWTCDECPWRIAHEEEHENEIPYD